jgi:zinc finger CCHC domain-containing protein 9
MTRVTSIGWKRTYVEAGFDHTEPSEPSQENAGNSPIAGDTSNGENAIPLKKKRKRTPKSKRDNYGGGLIEKVKEGNASDATSGQQVKLVQAATEGRAEGRQQAKVKKRTTTIRGGMERGVKCVTIFSLYMTPC